MHFNRWVASNHVDESYEKLREIVLIEEFKRRQAHLEFKTPLNDLKIEILDQAAIVANDYFIKNKLKDFGFWKSSWSIVWP